MSLLTISFDNEYSSYSEKRTKISPKPPVQKGRQIGRPGFKRPIPKRADGASQSTPNQIKILENKPELPPNTKKDLISPKPSLKTSTAASNNLPIRQRQSSQPNLNKGKYQINSTKNDNNYSYYDDQYDYSYDDYSNSLKQKNNQPSINSPPIRSAHSSNLPNQRQFKSPKDQLNVPSNPSTIRQKKIQSSESYPNSGSDHEINRENILQTQNNQTHEHFLRKPALSPTMSENIRNNNDNNQNNMKSNHKSNSNNFNNNNNNNNNFNNNNNNNNFTTTNNNDNFNNNNNNNSSNNNFNINNNNNSNINSNPNNNNNNNASNRNNENSIVTLNSNSNQNLVSMPITSNIPTSAALNDPVSYRLTRSNNVSLHGKTIHFQLYQGGRPLLHTKIKSIKGKGVCYVSSGAELHFKQKQYLGAILYANNGCTFSIRNNNEYGEEIMTILYKEGIDGSPRKMYVYFPTPYKNVPQKLYNRQAVLNDTNSWVLDMKGKFTIKSIKNCVIVDENDNEFAYIMKVEKDTLGIEAREEFSELMIFAFGLSSFFCKV